LGFPSILNLILCYLYQSCSPFVKYSLSLCLIRCFLYPSIFCCQHSVLLQYISISVLCFLLVLHLCCECFMLEDSKFSTFKNPFCSISLSFSSNYKTLELGLVALRVKMLYHCFLATVLRYRSQNRVHFSLRLIARRIKITIQVVGCLYQLSKTVQ
jgi:hypothetical protein